MRSTTVQTICSVLVAFTCLLHLASAAPGALPPGKVHYWHKPLQKAVSKAAPLGELSDYDCNVLLRDIEALEGGNGDPNVGGGGQALSRMRERFGRECERLQVVGKDSEEGVSGATGGEQEADEMRVFRRQDDDNASNTWPNKNGLYMFPVPWVKIGCFERDRLRTPATPVSKAIFSFAEIPREQCNAKVLPLDDPLHQLRIGEMTENNNKTAQIQRMELPTLLQVWGPFELYKGPFPEYTGANEVVDPTFCQIVADYILLLVDKCTDADGMVAGKMVFITGTRDSNAPRDGNFEGWVPTEKDVIVSSTVGVIEEIEGVNDSEEENGDSSSSPPSGGEAGEAIACSAS
ncbi:hypothetical protein BJ508DRAFT_367477 [Ascobolus immersus RN42]|uniref:Uncharacterized protein n=1 Tax=Ascobolus immersus RN42 TaxID=1160509 RepID=A0A3N4HGU1_ASCIM|nr:hypothetical protein BJ508DRAFT_367477 [Ascobolus immersus RN42]